MIKRKLLMCSSSSCFNPPYILLYENTQRGISVQISFTLKKGEVWINYLNCSFHWKIIFIFLSSKVFSTSFPFSPKNLWKWNLGVVCILANRLALLSRSACRQHLSWPPSLPALVLSPRALPSWSDCSRLHFSSRNTLSYPSPTVIQP